MPANERQVGGSHYKSMPLEHWDLSVLYGWDPFQYQITKYVMRWRDKNGIQDLEKVVHFAQKYVEIEKLRAEGNLTIELVRSTLARLMKEAHESDAAAEHAASIRSGADVPCLERAAPTIK